MFNTNFMPDANTLVAATVAASGVLLQVTVVWIGMVRTQAQIQEDRQVQRWSTEVAIATAIADKRQAWIDALSDDITAFLALSQEIAWTWIALYANIQNARQSAVREMYLLEPALVRATLIELRVLPTDAPMTVTNAVLDGASQALIDTLGPRSDRCPTAVRVVLSQLNKQGGALLAAFDPANGARDHEQQKLVLRIELRLNPDEPPHQRLVENLVALREQTLALSSASTHENARTANLAIRESIKQAKILAQKEMKREWRRLKQELADPARLISEIRSTWIEPSSPREYRTGFEHKR